MPNAYPSTVTVNVGALSIEDVVAVARYGATVEIAPEALEEVAATRERVEELAQDPTPVYGISTGFGALARRHIPEEMRAQLQLSLVRSHAAGTGPEVEEEVIRALMLLRLSTLCTGRTGVRPVVVETYAKALNAGIVPVVREYGSLGCSGDLAPLAHCALALLGEGEVRVNGELKDAGDALAAAGIEPLQLREKEGLALINGTDGMLGQLCLAITDLRAAAKTADIATAMTVEGLLGTLVVLPMTCSSCARTQARLMPRRISSRWPKALRSWKLRSRSSRRTRCRMRTPCAAPRRFPAGSAIPWPTPPRWPSASSPPRWITRW